MIRRSELSYRYQAMRAPERLMLNDDKSRRLIQPNLSRGRQCDWANTRTHKTASRTNTPNTSDQTPQPARASKNVDATLSILLTTSTIERRLKSTARVNWFHGTSRRLVRMKTRPSTRSTSVTCRSEERRVG